MQISDFYIRQVAFEVRFEPAYRLWDVSGVLFEQMNRIWPNTGDGKIEPSHLQLKSDTVDLNLTLRSCSVRIAKPKSVVQFADQIAATLETLFLHLDVKSLGRVGTRTIFAKSYPTAQAAIAATVALGLVRPPPAPIFNHKIGLAEAQARMVWRDDSMQTQVLVKAESQAFEVSGFDEFKDVPRKSESHLLILDIDRGTIGDVERSRFRASDWLHGVQHLLNRDINRLLSPNDRQE